MSYSSTATIRRAKTDDKYFRMHRDTAQDTSLSWEARGVIAYILSKPDNWDIQVHDLMQGCQKGRVYRILDELKAAGYLEDREKKRDDKGKWHWTPYILHERPITNVIPMPKAAPKEDENPYPEKQDTDNPYPDFRDTEKRDTENAEIKEQITDKKKQTTSSVGSSVVVAKSVAEPNIDPAYSHVMLAIQGLEMLNDKLRYAVKDWLKEYSEAEILKAIDTAIENRRNGTKIKSVSGYITGTLANQRREAAEQKQAEQSRPALVPYVPEPPISEEERQKAIAIMAERRKSLSTSTNTGGLYGANKAAGE